MLFRSPATDDLAFLRAQAQTAVRTAQQRLLAQGIGYVFSKDGNIVRRNPDEVVHLGWVHQASLTELRPRMALAPGSNGMEHVFGNWPSGDETDEEILAALEAIEKTNGQDSGEYRR